MYSDNLKQKQVREFIISVTNKFPKIYNTNVLRYYKQKKAEIYSSLFKNTGPAGLHICSIFLDKNIGQYFPIRMRNLKPNRILYWKTLINALFPPKST